jgi:hypothetical protein
MTCKVYEGVCGKEMFSPRVQFNEANSATHKKFSTRIATAAYRCIPFAAQLIQPPCDR